MRKKIEQLFNDLQVIAFEIVVLNTRFYWERILFIGWQYVKKQAQGFR